MPTIAYDRPVRDFIAALNETGHVSHTKHRKTKVTLHHNGGRLSLQGILEVWKVRPASAHFQVDGAGNIGQYVNVNEYAWSTGTTKGNQESISIEMANSSLASEWKVGGATTTNAARLAGWLFYRVIGTRPTVQNLVVHHHWKSTVCAGPYIDRVFGTILRRTQDAYDHFKYPPQQDEIEERIEDMGVRLVRGDSKVPVPGKSYTFGALQFLVRFDTDLPNGANRKYVPAGPVQRLLEKVQGGVDVVPQGDLDRILYAEGGRPPSSVTGS
jgi:hypothetical protein